MAYSSSSKRNNKNKKIRQKKTYKRGGSCGCNRITGGSLYLSDLSPQNYYAYNSNIQNDPNNHQLSTRMAGVDNLRSMTGGSRRRRRRRKRRSSKNKKQKKIVQTGGMPYTDFNIMNLGPPTNNLPSHTNHLLSTGQTNPNIPMVSPGIKYYV
jgi:hypothetical protein